MAKGSGGRRPPIVYPSRNMFNYGARSISNVFPDIRKRHVQLLSIEPFGALEGKWEAIIKVDGWPHSVALWGDYEMDIFRQVMSMFEKQGAIIVET